MLEPLPGVFQALLELAEETCCADTVDGEIVVQTIMSATLSCDHRAVDGVGAARFLGKLKERLEYPREWL
ncbi:MAG: 2-oxo acid dehydrogenase subunit E2 [Gammaproteobacteria bacterium]|nr:2-oxo acid dehydrogenase subunit E2 [Gammaproteobacteria bacterium]